MAAGSMGGFPGSSAPAVVTTRLLAAIVQAICLCLLTGAATTPTSWPATHPWIFMPALLVAVYLPLTVMFGVGQMPHRPLAVWAILVSVAVAALGLHAAARGRVPAYPGDDPLWPQFQLWPAVSASLFVAQALATGSIIERRLLPAYRQHFDTAWRLGVQTALTVVFVTVFWGVLKLGAALFDLVDIDLFASILQRRWFAFPATTLAVALSIHVTDVQPSLIRGIRVLALALFSWLLPLLAAILLAFLCSLPFLSLAPLWRTHFATALLLTAALLLVVLINSFYQDGAAEQTAPRVRRLAGTVAAVELVPLVGLAAWALALRVGEYGWTAERIIAAASVTVCGCYALGYASAVVAVPRWLQRLEATNVVAAYVFLALVAALFSPLADPARLMVASQMARLAAGTVAPDTFDFAALKFDGARWGVAALTRLSQDSGGGAAAAIAAKARTALALTGRYGVTPAGPVADRLTIYPAGSTLPTAFFDALAPWRASGVMPDCLRPYVAKCLVRMVTLEAGAPAIVLLDSFGGTLFEPDEKGRWHATARLDGATACEPVRRGIADEAIALRPHEWPDLVVGGERLALVRLHDACTSVARVR